MYSTRRTGTPDACQKASASIHLALARGHTVRIAVTAVAGWHPALASVADNSNAPSRVAWSRRLTTTLANCLPSKRGWRYTTQIVGHCVLGAACVRSIPDVFLSARGKEKNTIRGAPGERGQRDCQRARGVLCIQMAAEATTQGQLERTPPQGRCARWWTEPLRLRGVLGGVLARRAVRDEMLGRLAVVAALGLARLLAVACKVALLVAVVAAGAALAATAAGTTVPAGRALDCNGAREQCEMARGQPRSPD